MDEEKIISKEMVLTLFLIFSIFGVIYLYCAGVDSWEKFSSIEKENCAEYHLERFINHLEKRYTFERYNAALITASKLTSKRKRNKFSCFVNLWYGHLFRHVELDLKKALHYYTALFGKLGIPSVFISNVHKIYYHQVDILCPGCSPQDYFFSFSSLSPAVTISQ